MIFQNTIVRFIAFFIPVKDMRENFQKSYSRKTKFAKLRDKINRVSEQNILLIKENREIKQYLKRIETILINHSILTGLDIKRKGQSGGRVYLSVLSIAKNEGPYIKEWIEYHKLVGVERFYFYDNDSTDNTKEVLEPYINDGTVIYHEVPGKLQMIPAYRDCISKYKNHTRWLAIIDMDEFIVPIEKETIPEFLKDYEKYPAVGINWVMFDSNGHENKPSKHGGLLSANYTRVGVNSKDRLQGNIHIKSIINPKDVVTIVNPHYAVYKGGAPAVTENFESVYGPWTNVHSSVKIQINHYYTKSREEYLKRCQGGKPESNNPKRYFESAINFKEGIKDTAIQKYLPKLKEAMGVKD